MPDPARQTAGHSHQASLELVADLVLEVSDERGTATARLTGDGEGLVLDVSDPTTLLRCVPRGGWPDDLLGASPVTQLAGIPVRVTSRGRHLGRVSLTSSGKVRVRPALSSMPALVRTAAASRSGRVAASIAALSVTGALAFIVWRRGAGARRR